MFAHTASRDVHVAAAIAQTGVVSDTLHSLAGLFRTTVTIEQGRVVHLWWLAAFMTIGTAARFWGLGDVGLHGDEETMAMAAKHILVDGRPMLPGGMFYPRGLTQLYLMAISISLFGESEWALRLPSALCGVALIGLSYVVGRRFLRPCWNLAFVAAIAFLPALIIDAQTARMYVFLVTAVAACLACLFAWERTDRTVWLAAATAVLLLGIDMHTLAVAMILMFLLPGLLQADRRKLFLGAAAAAVVTVGFFAIDGWVSAQYPVPPPEFAADSAPAPRGGALRGFAVALWVAGLAVASLAVHFLRVTAVSAATFASAILLLVGIGLQLMLSYHLAALSYLAGIVVAHRYGLRQAVWRRLIFVVASGVLAIHVTQLASAGSIVKLVGTMAGQPSLWPYVRIAQFSGAAAILTAALLAWGLYQLGRNRPVPDYWLLAVLGVWAPVFAVGFFAWNIPPRYTEMSLVPMLLCAFAFAQRGSQWLRARVSWPGSQVKRDTLAAILTGICVIDPVGASAVINAGYRIHPDHKGAAQFMRSQNITDDDIVLAEDVLQQTYYLGAVDYWLIGGAAARRFVKRTDAGVVDFYTGTPVIVTVAMLDDLLQRNPTKRIFIVGSGEQQGDHRRGVRGAELHKAIESARFKVIYVGRDGVTRVFKANSGAATTLPSASPVSEEESNALAGSGGVAVAPKNNASSPVPGSLE